MMKPLLLRILPLAILASWLLSSCTGDGTGINPIENGPAISLATGAGLLTGDATVDVGAEFSVSLVGAKTDNDMRSILIEEAGAKIDPLRISLAANPLLLTGPTASAFTQLIKIKAHSDISTKTYSFIVEDVSGNKTTKSIAITTKGTPPSIVLSGNDNIIVPIASLFSTALTVTKGTSKLSTVEVLLDNAKAPIQNLFYGDQSTTAFTANPLPIPAADQDKFDSKIIVRTPNAAGTYKYTFKFTDATGLSTSQVVTVKVGTAVTMITGALLNSAGPIGTGGLDLDTGTSTGSSDANSEIRDLGINGNAAANNWRQQIGGIDNAEVKYLKKGQNGLPETFSFDNLVVTEDLAGLWSNATAFTATDNNKLISDKVSAGDTFIIKDGTKYYVIITREVKVTNNDNKDEYKFDIKH
jgi:hypothetical protein